MAWRGTYWTREPRRRRQADRGIDRPAVLRPVDAGHGPTFNRIFNTPGNGYAEKFKHVDRADARRSSGPPRSKSSPTSCSSKPATTPSATSRDTYGLDNILYAKKESSREIARVTLRQTYYTDENAAQYDRNYQSSYSDQAAPTKFSAVAFKPA